MNLSPSDRREIEALPPALRTLLEAELAAGNTIAEIGHSHPAPPVGAYVLLARRVTTQARATGAGLVFRERNSSLYSGEFTDEKRHFFLLEPPLPPPAEPDMDAIRRAANPVDPATAMCVDREPAVPRSFPTPAADRERPRQGAPARRASPAPAPPPVLAREAMRAARAVVFRDRRPPHELQGELERELMTPLAPQTDDGRLVYSGVLRNTGAEYRVRLALAAALARDFEYQVQIDVSWAHLPPSNDAYFRRSSASWMDLWTRHYVAVAPAAPGKNDPARYAAAVATALEAEVAVATVPALQQAILGALHAGATLATAHKEGGTRIRWTGRVFVRDDYGESERREEYADEGAFLAFLRQFYDCETSRTAPSGKVADAVAWRLIWRLLRRG